MVTLEEIEKADVSDLSVRTRVEAFYKGTDALSHFAQTVMIPVLRGQLNLNDREKAIVGTYFRMCGWLSSMVAMNHRIHYQGAAAASRSLFELLLDLKILAIDRTPNSVEKFHAFPEVDKYMAAKKLVSFFDSHPNTNRNDVKHQRKFINAKGRKQKVENAIKQYWTKGKAGKIRPPKHWTGKNARQRAVDIAQEYEELYIDAYPRLSWYIHSGSTGYAGVNEEALEACFGASHALAQKIFLEATLICAQEMKITCAVEGLQGMLSDLRLTPGKIIIKEQMKILKEAEKKQASQSIIVQP